jgi:hypothetical protein
MQSELEETYDDINVEGDPWVEEYDPEEDQNMENVKRVDPGEEYEGMEEVRLSERILDVKTLSDMISSVKPFLLTQEDIDIFVGNIHFSSKDADLENLFKDTVYISRFRIVKKHTGKTFAFFRVHSLKDARYVVERMHGYMYMDRSLVVRISDKEQHKYR